ncbi:serine/threonine-protein kinase [Agromyces sp. NPDC058104]|uniref:serine/threonine-protein kinase n=1 Tax=Agromyces sp. NPDC058104 TaxID=3346342 RepID=UPI0036DF5E85
MTSISDRDRTEPTTGRTLGGRYRLDALIGRGGMASVYRGFDESLGRPVAVKVFSEAAEGIDDAGRRASEIALLASVEHRALVRLYDAARDADSDREYLVMELVEGHDLRVALQHGPLDAADAAGLLADVGEALHVIHSRGIVHRDVKPANVLLEPAHLPSRRWNAKLADFGIARLIDDARITRTGLLVGTPGYLSPEQVSGVAPGSAADVYSLGLLVLEARTGRRAFPGPAVEAASARLVNDPEIPDELGAAWAELLTRMTAREPGVRPTALEVAVAAAALATAPEGSSPASAAPSAPASASASPTPSLIAVNDPAPTAPHSGDSTAALGATAPFGVLPDREPTAPTRVLPADGAPIGTPDSDPPATAPSGPAPATRRRARRTTPASRGPLLVVLLAIAAVAVVLGAHAAITAVTDSGSEPAPLPSIPAELDPLGEHLRQLDEAVR